MSGIVGGGTSQNQAALLEILAKPEAARRTIAELKAAEDHANAAREKAVDAQRAAAADRSTVDAKLEQLATREAAHAKAVADFNRQQETNSNALALREQAVRYRLHQLDKDNAALAAGREQLDNDTAARQREAAQRQAELERRDAAVTESQKKLLALVQELRTALDRVG